MSFLEHSLTNYAKSTLPYMEAAFLLAETYLQCKRELEPTLQALAALDWHHHTLLLNHVSRRASMIQGMAMLSLYMRSFVDANEANAVRAKALVSGMRTRIRRGGASLQGGATALGPSELPGHLAIATGVFSACIGLSVERTLHLQLFLQARNLMSCSVRLNTLGPYMAHQLLARPLRETIESILPLATRHAAAKLVRYAQIQTGPAPAPAPVEGASATFDWDWVDDEPMAADVDCACTTWPLGEIVQARHDQLHSRLFNS